MSGYTTLLGVEDVRAAGNAMTSAAQQMQSAAITIDTVMWRHQRFLDDWLVRFAEAMQIASPAGGTIRSAQDEAMEATPTTWQQPVGVVSASRGHPIEYTDADIVVTTLGKIVKSVDYTINVIVVDHLTLERVS